MIFALDSKNTEKEVTLFSNLLYTNMLIRILVFFFQIENEKEERRKICMHRILANLNTAKDLRNCGHGLTKKIN